MATPIANTWFAQAYYQETPDAFWRLGDQPGSAAAADQTLNAYDGTVVGGVIFGQTGWSGDGTTAAAFDGSTGYVDAGIVAALAYTSRFSIVAAFKTSLSQYQSIVSKNVLATSEGWALFVNNDGKVRFSAYSDTGAVVFDFKTPSAYADGNYHVVVATLDRQVDNLATLSVDSGVAAVTAVPVAGLAPAANDAHLLIGANDDTFVPAFYFNGTLGEVALYPYRLSQTQRIALVAARLKTFNDRAIQQARAGLARSGATRSNYFTTRSIVLIGGVDYRNNVKKGTLRSSDILNDQPDTASLTVFTRQSVGGFAGAVSGFASAFDPDGFYSLGSTASTVPAPVVGATLILADGADNNRYFGGTIVRSKQRPTKNPQGVAVGIEQYDIQATDWTWLFNRKTLTKQYPAGTLANIVAIDIVESFTDGFTTNNVQAAAPALTSALTFKGMRAGDAMGKLCQSIVPNYNWYPDVDQDVHFFDTEATKRPKSIVPGVYTYDQLEHQDDLTQIRTRILAEGSGGSTTEPVPALSTSIPVDECGWYSQTGGTVCSASQNILITYTGVSATSGPGDLTGIPPIGTGSLSVPLLQGDNLAVWVVVDDLAAQDALGLLEGGDGIHEFYLQVPYGNIDQCTSAALAELAAFGDLQISGTIVSRDKAMRSGKTLAINLTSRNIAVTATIQQVDRYLVGPTTFEFRANYASTWRNLVHVLKRAGKVGGR